MNMFEYYFTSGAKRDIKRLPKRFQRQVFDAIEAACSLEHPLKSRNVRKLEGYGIPTYRIRSGDYRIIFRITRQMFIVAEIRNRQAGY